MLNEDLFISTADSGQEFLEISHLSTVGQDNLVHVHLNLEEVEPRVFQAIANLSYTFERSI